MIYLNQYHRESTERKLRKMEEWKKSPMNSIDAANYMKKNFEMAKHMYAILKYLFYTISMRSKYINLVFKGNAPGRFMFSPIDFASFTSSE